MFNGIALLARSLVEQGQRIVVACNDPADQQLANQLLEGLLTDETVCPRSPEDYFRLLSGARAVVTGRLHTAVASFSLGVPFVLLDSDQRTHGFIKTYQMENWSVVPTMRGVETRLKELTGRLLSAEAAESWELLISKRDDMYIRAMNLLGVALEQFN